MAVALDTSSKTHNNTQDSNTVTLAHTCTGSNMLLVVWIAASPTSGNGAVTATYNGNAMTQIGSARQVGTDATYVYGFYIVVGTGAGSSQNIVVSKTNAAVNIAAQSFTGVDQASPVGTSQNGSSNGASSINLTSITIPSGGGGSGAGFCNNPTTINPANGATKAPTPNESGFPYGDLSASYYLTSGSFVFGWTNGASGKWGGLAVPINATAVTTTSTTVTTSSSTSTTTTSSSTSISISTSSSTSTSISTTVTINDSYSGIAVSFYTTLAS